MRMLGDREDAQEVVQEVFLRVLRSEGQFRGDSEIATWILQITYNECFRRVNQRRPATVSLEVEDPLDQEDDPHVVLEKTEFQRQIELIMTRLTPQQAAALTLYAKGGRSYKEIATILNISEGLVAATLSRARERMKKMMKKKGILP